MLNVQRTRFVSCDQRWTGVTQREDRGPAKLRLPRRGPFPNRRGRLETAVAGFHRAEKAWTMPAREWSMAKAQFAVLFGERFTRAMA
jgi:transposase-like protein